MARAKLKAHEAQNVKMYMHLVNGRIDFDGGNWFIDTPDVSKMFHSTKDMMEYINEDLEYIAEAYRNNNELGEWEEIERLAMESRLEFGFESDRIDRRRYEHE